MADITPEIPQVVAQDAKVVGDADLAAREPQATIVQQQVAAQVAQPREGAVDKVNVHEVYIAIDEVITDPSSPLAVQVPDAGRGSLSLPMHALNGPTPEQVFAAAADES